MERSDWTDKRIATLKRMAAERHTAADVAVRLGISRSAVLGKANRLGVTFNGGAPGRPSSPKPERPRLRFGAARMTVDGETVDVGAITFDTIPAGVVPAFTTEIQPAPAPDLRFDMPVPATLLPAPKPGATGWMKASGEVLSEPSPDDVAFVIGLPRAREPTPKGWPKPAGPNAVDIDSLLAGRCHMPLWAAHERSGLYCGEPVVDPATPYCQWCRPLMREQRQARTVQEREGAQAKLAATGRYGAFV